jgi:hypothetical protein
MKTALFPFVFVLVLLVLSSGLALGGEIKVYDDSDQYLGLYVGTADHELVYVFVPGINGEVGISTYYCLNNDMTNCGSGHGALSQRTPFYLNENCSGTPYVADYDGGIAPHKWYLNSDDPNMLLNATGEYILNYPQNVSYWDEGSCHVSNAPYWLSPTTTKSIVELGFSLPIALPLRTQYVEEKKATKTVVVPLF